MGGILSCAACSAVQCCASAACTCCGNVVPCKSSRVTRGVYAIIFLLTAIAAWVVSNWGADFLKFIPELGVCDGNVVCYSFFSVYRVSFALTCFHLLLALLLIGVKSSTDCRFFIQGGSLAAWFLKIIVWLGAIVGCFFIPNVVFYYYAWISVFGSCIFLLIQVILLIEFAYEWNESWVQKWHGATMDENRKWFWILLIATIGILLLTLALTIVMYVFFAKSTDCGLNIFFITFGLVLAIVCAVASVLPKVQEWNPKSGLLQAAIIVFYATWLVWSAIQSQPANPCNSLTGNQTANQTTIILGAIFSLAAVVYSTVSAGSSTADTLRGTTSIAAADVESAKSDDTTDDDAAVDAEALNYNYTFFHLTFALGAMYIGMLMTNWVVLGGTGSTLSVDSGLASQWVKIVTSWLTILIFLWTVFAPKILANRDFS